ncbi:MAG: glycosyltransferase family 2 protein [Candidatus Hydrogenedentota bacterium]|nr:MAG: glycosyltransferase family 2 protein [Candidatus Hydrogenedentota bacterium]
MWKSERVGLVIPAFNEERSVGAVVEEFRGLCVDGAPLLDRIVVCDNASTDATAAEAERGGAEVVREEIQGYGAACLAGIATLGDDVEIVAFADADRSDDPAELPRLLEEISRGADLVIGSRVLGRAEPGALTPQQRFGNALAAFLIRLRWNAPVTDLGPFRVIRRRALERLAMADRTYGWTVEMQVKAIKRGLVIREVPVTYRRRVGKSKISGTVKGTIGAGVKILGTIFLEGLIRK